MGKIYNKYPAKKYCLECKINEVSEDYDLECYDCNLKFNDKMVNLQDNQKIIRAINADKNKELNKRLRLQTKTNKLKTTN